MFKITKKGKTHEESDADSLFSLRSDSSIGDNSIMELTDDQVIEIDNFVMVQFPTKSTVVYYIGRILEEIGHQEFKIKFLRKKFNKNKFYYPEVDDIAEVNRIDIITILPDPVLKNKFDVNFDNYHVNYILTCMI